MRFPEHWLREWVNPRADTDDLCERLTLLGLEVDSTGTAAPPFSGVVVGEILSVKGHPEADRLQVCRVTDGAREYQVVCGAPNAVAGVRVAFARAGAVLPGGGTIHHTKIRGVESAGMLCSARELGLEQEVEGLLELPADAPPGENLRRFARLDEAVIELELTPNRGDCLSLRGIAREVGAAWKLRPGGPPLEPVPATRDEAFAVWLEASAACPRYVGRVIREVDNTRASPVWLLERLQRSGIRPLSPVVDVTNYVMLELGQPMHAFDLRRLSESIVVRWSRSNERLSLLDGRSVALDDDTLVIADGSGPVALAGIMGGDTTAVTTDTRDVFLESACFMPEAMAGRARRYAAHTDSSHRFERGVDPELQKLATERATALILQICGGQPGPAHDSVETDRLPRRRPITLRASRLERLLGYRTPNGEVEDILRRLGLRLTSTGDGWSATPPSWRFDLQREADLIEEVARVRGYNRAPRTHGRLVPHIAPRAEARWSADTLRQVLAERDYHEVVTYSFVDPALQRMLDPEGTALSLANPIAADMGVMRTRLLPGLVRTLQHNLNRQQERVRLFELGRVFRPQAGVDLERDMLAGVVSGPRWPEQWDSHSEPADFYDVKADIEALLGPARLRACAFVADSDPALHPGQAARIEIGGEVIGRLGALHPRLQRELELEQSPILFELSVEAVRQRGLAAYQPVSRFPSIRRDLALVVDEGVPAGRLLDSVRQAVGEELHDVFIFDVYRGSGVDSGRKSVALGLILQGLSRTLTDSEVETAVRAILDRLRQRHGATLRE